MRQYSVTQVAKNGKRKVSTREGVYKATRLAHNVLMNNRAIREIVIRQLKRSN